MDVLSHNGFNSSILIRGEINENKINMKPRRRLSPESCPSLKKAGKRKQKKRKKERTHPNPNIPIRTAGHAIIMHDI
jgi:hypothetical protein